MANCNWNNVQNGIKTHSSELKLNVWKWFTILRSVVVFIVSEVMSWNIIILVIFITITSSKASSTLCVFYNADNGFDYATIIQLYLLFCSKGIYQHWMRYCFHVEYTLVYCCRFLLYITRVVSETQHRLFNNYCCCCCCCCWSFLSII